MVKKGNSFYKYTALMGAAFPFLDSDVTNENLILSSHYQLNASAGQGQTNL